ncbi:MAG: branched-chain amino acid ABC transporter permease [Candidatus Hadarchaeota archaeon]
MSYLPFVISVISVNLILVAVIHMQFGLTGISNFAVAAFYGIGAYTAAIISYSSETVLTLQLPFIVGVVMAGIVGGIIALIFGWIILKRRDMVVFIVTLVSIGLLQQLAKSQDWLTNGVRGIAPISYPVDQSVYVLIILALTAGIAYYIYRLKRSPYGTLLKGVRDNQLLAQATGKDTFKIKLQVFAIGSAIMSVAGALSIPLISDVSPSIFDPNQSFMVWTAMIIGGKDKIVGALTGGLIVFGFFRFAFVYLPIPSFFPDVTVTRFIILGIVLVLTLKFRPEGIFGERFTD